jgi:hypothetical protein
MKPRLKPTPAPASARYWTCTLANEKLPGEGAHTFRHPFYGVGAQLLLYSAAHYVPPEGDERPLQARVLTLIPCAGALIGACWSHTTHALETPAPREWNGEQIPAYGNAVVEELQEAGYDLLEITELFSLLMPEFVRRQSLVSMAQERAAFSEPPKAVSTFS